MRADEQRLRAFVTTRSEEAFRGIVADHMDAVYAVAIRVLNGDAALAQDVAQTVFADLARKAGSIRQGAMVGAWLCRRAFFIASGKVREEIRRRRRERELVCMNEPIGIDEARWEQVRCVLDESVQALGAADREAIALRFFHGWDLKRVGAALGVGEDAAQKRVARALEKLRRALGKRGVTMSAGGLLAELSSQAMAAAPIGFAAQVSAAVLSGATAGSGMTVTWLIAVAHLKSNALVGAGFAGLLICLALLSLSLWRTNHEQRSAVIDDRQPLATRAVGMPRALAENGAAPFRWSEVESPDYPQLAANLRAIGCPEPTIRDILIGRLNRAYAPQVQAIWKPGAVPYWKRAPRQTPSEEHLAALRRVSAEKWQVLKAATGRTANGQEIVDLVYLQSNELDNALAFLRDSRREPARRALLESGVADRLASLRLNSDGREVFADALRSLEPVLTAEELDEYHLRNSPRAQWLRDGIAYFDCTLEEFRTMLDRIDSALADKPDHLALDRDATLVLARSLFGELRACEFERVTDFGYLNTRRQAHHAGLPPELADQAGQIAYEARVAVEQTARDNALSQEQKRAQMEYFQAQAEQQMRSVLGANAKPAIINSMKMSLGNTAALGLR